MPKILRKLGKKIQDNPGVTALVVYGTIQAAWSIIYLAGTKDGDVEILDDVIGVNGTDITTL